MDLMDTKVSGEPFNALCEALEEKRLQLQEGVLSWSNVPRYPWRKPGKTPYEVLIGEFWLGQTSSVAEATHIYHSFIQHFFLDAPPKN